MDAQTLGDIPSLTRLTGMVTAVGALGVAAYGLVDASKAFWGGVSTRGFANIAKEMAILVPEASVADATKIPTGEPASPPPLSLASILVTLKSNWINGMASSDQRAIAKTLVKLRLNANSAKALAGVAGVDATVLSEVASKIVSGAPLTQTETDVYGRFDLILTTMLDQAYQRADQQYRNTAKAAAVIVAVILAEIGAWSLGKMSSVHFWQAFLLGLIATPIAPIAKDLSSAIQAGAKVAQEWTWRS